MKKNQPIVIIDSGIGGINIAKQLSMKLENEHIIAISDNLYMPYGLLTRREIIRRINYLLKTIRTLDPKAIVIGCNTIDAICGEKLVSEFPGISVFRVIKESAKVAAKTTKNNNIAVFATPATTDSQIYMQMLALYKNNLNVYGICCDELASLIEAEDFKNKTIDEEVKLATDLDCDTLILGCTHYNLIINKFAKYYPNAAIIDSADQLCNLVCEKMPILNAKLQYQLIKPQFEVYLTKVDKQVKTHLEKMLGNIDYTIKEI